MSTQQYPHQQSQAGGGRGNQGGRGGRAPNYSYVAGGRGGGGGGPNPMSAWQPAAPTGFNPQHQQQAQQQLQQQHAQQQQQQAQQHQSQSNQPQQSQQQQPPNVQPNNAQPSQHQQQQQQQPGNMPANMRAPAGNQPYGPPPPYYGNPYGHMAPPHHQMQHQYPPGPPHHHHAPPPHMAGPHGMPPPYGRGSGGPWPAGPPGAPPQYYSGAPGAGNPSGMQPHHLPAGTALQHHPHPGQQQQQQPGLQNPYAGASGGGGPPHSLQAARGVPGAGGGAAYYPPPPHGMPGPGAMGGPGPGGAMTGQPPGVPVVVPAPRKRSPLMITDKDGNPIDLGGVKPKKNDAAAAATANGSAAADKKAAAQAEAAAAQAEAGAKLRQAALDRISGEADRKKKELEERLKKEAEEKALAKKQAEETAAKEAEKKAAAEAAAAKQQAEEAEEKKAKKEAEEKAAAAAEEAKQSSHLAVRLATTNGGTTNSISSTTDPSKRRVYSKEHLLQLRETSPKERPDTLPDLTIVKGPSRGKTGPGGGGGGGGGGDRGGGDRGDRRQGNRGGGGGGGDRGGDRGMGGGDGGGGGGGNWERGSAPPRRQGLQGEINDNNRGGGGGGGGGGRNDGGGGGGQWARGVAPPKVQQNRGGQGGGGGARGGQRGGRGGGQQQQDFYDGPVAPLVKSDNHWRPKKNSNSFVVAEKQVKSILNKMTKEKFDRLSEQMLQVPITSSEILKMMIDTIFDKAIDEPSFGDMYADLCVRLSQSAQASSFIHIIESDEEPPTEDGTPAAGGESSAFTVYRWSNDISTSDDQIVGPYATVDDCFNVALSNAEETPKDRGDMILELESVTIKSGIFIKILKLKEPIEGEPAFYTVYFPVADAEECGQQLSPIFLSDIECASDASKRNSFKRSLLNKCEDEFNKQDIYAEWKTEKSEYEKNKKNMTEKERAEKEEDFNFRRIKIKKQMLGNVKFIGQLYKKSLLKEKIMRYCIGSLLKLKAIDDSVKSPEYKDSGDRDMDEEDHEAICSIFATIGATIDTPAAFKFMNVCFTKIKSLGSDKKLPSRSRFMYKDLLELRANKWIPRRKEEKAKTLEEIRKDVEREERKAAALAANAPQGGMGGGRGGGGGGPGGGFGARPGGRGSALDLRQSARPLVSSARPRAPKASAEVDEDGFMTIGGKGAMPTPTSAKKSFPSSKAATPAPGSTKLAMFDALAEDGAAAAAGSKASAPAPLDEKTVERRIGGMRTEFISTGGNVDELLLTFDELSGTPGVGKTLVSKNMDRLTDCKEDERLAIVKILVILAEKGKLTAADVQEGLTDTIEFIDSIFYDAPRVFEFVGDILSELLRIKVIDMQYICEQCERTKDADPNTPAPVKIVTETLQAVKKKSGAAAAKELATSAADATTLTKLLGADKWKSISAAL